jgi:hypothetical protein
MTATRGVRYLLRNGLDYLNYQQYDRALKFLREAETYQKQLNDAEKLALKQGIERAQRGLREASDAEVPYALSERSRPRSGFNPAKPESTVASRSDSTSMPAGTRTTNRLAKSDALAGDSEEQGEPIQLAGGGVAVVDESVQNSQAGPVQQNALPPRIATVPDVNSSPASSPTERPAELSPRALPTEKEFVLSPVPTGETSPPAAAVTIPSATPSAIPAPSPNELSPASDASTSPKATADARVINLETVNSPPVANDTTSATIVSGPEHREFEDATPASLPKPAPDATTPSPIAESPQPNQIAPAAAEQLPPLPLDLGQATGHVPAEETTSTPAAAPMQVQTAVAPASTQELPPLPPNLGADNAASSAPATAPTAGPDALNEPSASQATPRPNVDDSLPPLPGDNKTPSTTQNTQTGIHQDIEAGRTGLPLQAAPFAATEGTNPPHLSAESAPSTAPSAEDAGPSRVQAPDLAAPVLGSEAVAPVDPKLGQQPANDAAANSEMLPTPSSLPPAIENQPLVGSSSDLVIPERRSSPSTLRPELQREVEIIARKQEEDLRRQTQNQPQPAVSARDTNVSDLRTQTQLDISRAPSPAEARPIRAIAVPDDWVALAPRAWSPERKYWAAAATCHLPLYFQDPVLERYGHSVEHFAGPIGRYLTYPVDDPTQSTQRNQILQPFFSAGLFALQIAALPYNVIMDPPWEAQYDLGYYRPGDNIPVDTYWLPLHGYGPPLHGSSY